MRLLNRNWSSVRERCRRRLIVWHLWVLRLFYIKRPVSLNYWLLVHSAVQRTFRPPDSLIPAEKFLRSVMK